MADRLRSAYKDLFGLYPDAYKRSEEELRDFFSTKVPGGELVLSLTVKTFKTLCEFADFEALTEAVPPTPIKAPSVASEIQAPQLVLNLNIQLQLPVTENAEVYEKIFKALRECLLVRS